MMSMIYRFSALLLLLLILAIGVHGNSDPTLSEFDVEAVTSRVEAMKNDAVEPQYNNIVQGYIKTYVLKRRDTAERILGLSVMYFPIFEKYLAENNLPLDLRYLPVVESALNPRAISRVGAGGLWQFMPETGREMGLRIDQYVDERCDPHKSTQAAMVFLTKLYERYGRWELALAAYNSGPGRVNRAIKRGRSRNFWRIRRYLPRETRNYVPAFIAATYLLNHYDQHELNPNYPQLDLQVSETVKIFESFSFYEIAQVTGLSLDVIDKLNPSYELGYIPTDSRGQYLTLPRRVMSAFQHYATLRQQHPNLRESYALAPVTPSMLSSEELYLRTIYLVQPGDELHQLSAALNCTVHQLRAWNQLKNNQLSPGQELVVYQPRENHRFIRNARMEEEMKMLDQRLGVSVAPQSQLKWEKDPLDGQKRIFYYVKKTERLKDIARKLPGTTIGDLLTLNDYQLSTRLKPGTRVCIQEL